MKECWNPTCGERRLHWCAPYTPRGTQKVEVPDDHHGPIFCSNECAAYYGAWTAREGWRITLFYGHTKPNGFMSNWFPSEIRVSITPTSEPVVFSCVEQLMMYDKAGLFDDNETAKKILKAKHPKQYKELGRQVKNFDQKLWDDMKYDIVYDAVLMKFQQNDSLREQLLATGGTLIAEASPTDAIWGIALSANDQLAKQPGSWKGKNLLGNALMEVRRELQ
jgi:ribA/ribD-fused uncharacterized protein